MNTLKYFLSTALLVVAINASAQMTRINSKPLDEVDPGLVQKPDQTIIYGSFMRIPGMWNTAGSSLIYIINMNTRQIYTFEVKSNNGTARETTFCNFITPGKYAILYYLHGKSKWYGSQITRNPVYKNANIYQDLKAKVDSGLLKTDTLKHFFFTIDKPGLIYLGRWHFDTGNITFSDDKAWADQKIPKDYYFLECDKARTIIPN